MMFRWNWFGHSNRFHIKKKIKRAQQTETKIIYLFVICDNAQKIHTNSALESTFVAAVLHVKDQNLPDLSGANRERASSFSDLKT